MTSSEQVREEVAAVLDSVFGVEFSRPYEDVLRDGVDAILSRWPVLAGVTDEMVEAGARALFEDLVNSAADHVEYSWAELVAEDPWRADIWREDARTVLVAVREAGRSNLPGEGARDDRLG